MMKKKSSVCVFKNERLSLIEDEYQISSSKIQKYSYIDKPNSVLIIPVFDKKIGLIKIKRPAYNWEYRFELPGGRIDFNEEPEQCALRELKEETNLDAESIIFLQKVFPLPSICNEEVFIFKAKIKSIQKAKPQESEFIKKVVFFNLFEINEIIRDGKIGCSADGYALLLACSYES